MALIASCAVENTSFSFDKPFSYLVPTRLEAMAQAGCRALVPFGKGNRLRTAMILEITHGEETKGLKAVCEVMDAEPIVHQKQLDLCKFLAEHTFAPLYSVISQCIPTGMKMNCHGVYKLLAFPSAEAFAALSDEQQAFLNALQQAPEGIDEEAAEKIYGFAPSAPLLTQLIGAEYVLKTGNYVRFLGDASVKMVRLTPNLEPIDPANCPSVVSLALPGGYEQVALTPKQRSVVQLLAQSNANLKEVCYLAGVTRQVVDNLVRKGVLEFYEYQVYRNPYESATATRSLQDMQLNEAQQQALEQLWQLVLSQKPAAALLYGVTGSGKTAVFLKLIQKVLNQGRNVLMLVPEIALTAQTIAGFHAYFGQSVAVIHSGLAVGERLDEWKRIRNGEVRIVIGTRSAVFSPLENIGLIVMDEEQEHSYQSEQTPRYHARTAAKYRSVQENALLLMASATPEIESYHAAKTGKYTLCTLPGRFNQEALPNVILVDMNEEQGRGYERISDRLLEEIELNLKNNEQTILLCNRRGFHTTVTCPVCKTTEECPNCSISLTYHKTNEQLICHYCGFSKPAPKHCEKCGGETMKYSGVGTQNIVAQLQELFPTARILRMDQDTTMAKFSHDTYFKDFAAHQYDILVGTQMVAKGLDFPLVTLVGVLGADKAVFSGDFQGAHRAFSLITQVVGRCGRGEKPGRAVLQTMDPDSELIEMACSQDYSAFYESEIAVRQWMLYPPFCDVIALGFSSPEEPALLEASAKYLAILRQKVQDGHAHLPLKALGPVKSTVYRVGGRYRCHILLKCRNTKELRSLLKEVLVEFEEKFPKVRLIMDANGLAGY